MLESLREEVCEANLLIRDAGLVTLTWGNASGYDPDAGAVAIKPSGVSYAQLRPDHMIVVSVSDGQVLWGDLRPSSDTPTHLELYRRLTCLRGIVHTHSTYATAWAQANRPIPCYGTTHADHFSAEVPVTRALTAAEIAGEYELETGLVIANLCRHRDPLEVPAALVAGHGAFTWGRSCAEAAENAIALEEVARLAWLTETLAEDVNPIPQNLVMRHFLRKHGPSAYYGQPDMRR